VSPKITIVPDELRAASRAYLDSGAALRAIDGRLRVPPPDMPGDLRDRAISTVADITRDVAEQEQYIRDEASELVRRAGLAERADGAAILMVIGLLESLGLGGIRGLSDRFTPAGLFGDREDRRIANDERAGIPPGGRQDSRLELDKERGINLENDWAGREILARYLTGGDDWTITNDPDWTRYMMANDVLTGKVSDLVRAEAQRAFDRRGIGPASDSFDYTTSMEVQNGEGISGYQYLHGTNADVGGFRFQGSTHIERVPGGYEVRIPASYTWNDIMDPNPEYSTDSWKSKFAEVVTLGRADPYDFHLTWSGEATVLLDEHGNPVSVRGYPDR